MLIGALVVCLFCWVGSVAAEPRVALVIGNSTYGGEIGNLANPANDAKLMAKTLRGIGFDVVEVENADQNAMKRAIVDFGNKLSDAGSDATGLFYYAGHGLQVQGENFLIPVKAHIEREADVDIEAVSADLVLKQMDFAGSAVNIVILDACRNNPLTRGFRSEVRGLAEITRKPRGSFIAYSTAPGEVAADGNGANSPYAKALAETIVAPGEGIEEMFRDVRGKVLAATDSKQTPWDSSSLTAPFYFRPPAAPAASAPTAAVDSMDPKRIELAFWESIKDSKSPDDFQAYLSKYPQGDFASLAANRLKSLGATASAVPAPDTTIRNMPPGKDDETAIAYEKAFWESVKDAGGAEDLQAYLKKYPHGQFAAQAEQKLKALNAPPSPAPESTPVASPPTFDAVDRQVYARDQARLRAAPDKNAEVIDRAAANAAFKATGRSKDGAWWRIAMADGRTGYIAGSVVSEQPILAAITPTPIPAPTAAAPAPVPSGTDADTCKTGSSAAPADRVAACQRVLDGGKLDKDTRMSTLIDLGNAYYDGNQYDPAMRSYRAALELDPNSAAAYFDIGMIHFNSGRYVEARAAFDKSASRDPSDSDSVMRRGTATANLGDFDSGLRDVQRSIAMNPKNGGYYEELALLQLDTGNVADAMQAIDKTKELNASYAGSTAVIVYYVAGKLDQAEAAIAKGIESDASYPYWPIWRSLVQRAGGDESGAMQTLDQGLRLGSQWPAPVMQFLAGKITESKLRTLANAGDQKTRTERLCEVEFYRGERAYLAGDKATAKAAMQAATGARIYYYLEDAAARARLAQLND